MQLEDMAPVKPTKQLQQAGARVDDGGSRIAARMQCKRTSEPWS